MGHSFPSHMQWKELCRTHEFLTESLFVNKETSLMGSPLRPELSRGTGCCWPVWTTALCLIRHSVPLPGQQLAQPGRPTSSASVVMHSQHGYPVPPWVTLLSNPFFKIEVNRIIKGSKWHLLLFSLIQKEELKTCVVCSLS